MQPEKMQNVDMVVYVARAAQDVSINMEGVAQLAIEAIAYMIHNFQNLSIDEVAFGRYVRLSSELHPKPDDHRAADWLFVLNTLNFALWTRKNQQEWRVDGLTGYMALCAAIKRAIDDGKPMWDSTFYTKLSLSDMKHIFRGDDDNVIPSIFQRMALLRSVGDLLLTSYKGTFKECIKSCQRDAIKLVQILAKFPSYNDETTYDNQPVLLWTKAWILVTDIWSFFDSKHELSIKMTTAKYSTMFADYRVIGIFNHFNALVYSEHFLDKFKEKDELVMHGSREELELRCCSLLIARHIYDLIMEKYEYKKTSMSELQLSSFDGMCLVDNFLWDYQQIYDEQLKKDILCKISTEQY